MRGTRGRGPTAVLSVGGSILGAALWDALRALAGFAVWTVLALGLFLLVGVVAA